MSDKIIGKVMLKPETVVCGQSIFIEVTAPNGKEYTVSGETIVRINGIIGAQQYLQFDHPGDRTIFIVAARNGVVETTTAKVHVIDPDIPTTTLNGDGLRIMALMHNPMFKILPMLRIARSPRQPYVTALSLGRTLFVNGFSAGPDIHEISDQLNETLESKFEAIEALGQSMPIGPETLSSGPFIGEAVNGGRPIPFSYRYVPLFCNSRSCWITIFT